MKEINCEEIIENLLDEFRDRPIVHHDVVACYMCDNNLFPMERPGVTRDNLWEAKEIIRKLEEESYIKTEYLGYGEKEVTFIPILEDFGKEVRKKPIDRRLEIKCALSLHMRNPRAHGWPNKGLYVKLTPLGISKSPEDVRMIEDWNKGIFKEGIAFAVSKELYQQLFKTVKYEEYIEGKEIHHGKITMDLYGRSDTEKDYEE